MKTIIAIGLVILATYFAIGILFGLYFLFCGAPKIDPLLSKSKRGIRILLFPGIVLTWPFFVAKLFFSKPNPR